MKKLKKIAKVYLQAVSILCTLTLIAPLATAATLKLVADNWPPFTSEISGQRVAVDLVEKALRLSGIETKATIIQWKDVIDGIKDNKYDAIVGAWKNPDREKFLYFSRPYLENRILLVGRIDNKINFTEISQLENRKIGVVEGYAYSASIANNAKIVKVNSRTITDNIKKLISRDVDYILTDSIVAQSMKRHLPQEIRKQLVIYGKVAATQKLHFAIRKNYPDANALLEKFNNSIRKMISDGSYNRILGFAWLVADTDGDGVDEYIVGDQVPSTNNDPAISGDSYPVFSEEQNAGKKPAKRYRVLNLEYNSWEDAQQAINQAQVSGRLQFEDKDSGAVDLFSGKF